jgi:hypothetical protein
MDAHQDRLANEAITQIRGGCLCGASRYASEAHVLGVRFCHCRTCQKATGSPLYARVQVPLDTVTISGPVSWFHSSVAVRRGFCSLCGTTLFAARAANNTIGLTMGSLDEPDAFAPTDHIWMSRKQACIKLCDGLPFWLEGPPA